MAAPGPAARAAVAAALGAAAANTDAAVPPLAQLLADADATVRIAAARGLAAAGARAKPVARQLAEALRDRTPQVRVFAAVASVRAGGDAAVAAACVLNECKNADASVRRAALASMADVGVPKKQAVTAFVAATKDPDVAVRIAAIEGLGASGPATDEVLDALAKCAASPEPDERNAALAAIPRVTDLPVAEAVRLGGPMRGDRMKRRQLASLGGGQATSDAVAAGLDWLARHQAPDGSWGVASYAKCCVKDHCGGETEYTSLDPGVTGLALLAFLGAGETHADGPHKDAVARGVANLVSIMDSEGCIGSRSAKHFLYSHAVGTTALCEAYMLTGDPAILAPAKRAAAFALKAKNPYLAWRYAFPPDGDNDTSSTSWMCWALATARAAGIEPVYCSAALDDALSWVEKMTEPEFGRTGYQQRGGPSSRLNNSANHFPTDRTETTTAMGLMIRIFAGRTPKGDPFLGKGSDLLRKKPPRWDSDAGSIDFVYWFWSSCAARQLGGPLWKTWSDALKSDVVAKQRTEKGRCARGSWDTIDAWSPVGGRVYATALCCMCLESYWRTDRLVSDGK
jgi:hypothetical protein